MKSSFQQPTGRVRVIIGKFHEEHVWEMKTPEGGFGAAYFYGADMEFVQYAATKEKAIAKLNMEVDRSMKTVYGTIILKEKYWDGWREKYPEAVDAFCKWIDMYKAAIGWNQLFNSDSNWQDGDGKNAPAPKFHQIPVALQWGIFLQFISDYGIIDDLPHEFSGVAVHVNMESCLHKLQERITNSPKD